MLVGAVRDGLGLLTWEEESFAFADSFDEPTGRYRGLRGGQLVSLVEADSPGLLVKGSVARSQLDADSAKVTVEGGSGTQGDGVDGQTTPSPGPTTSVSPQPPPAALLPRRFHGTVTLDATARGPRCRPGCRRGHRTPHRTRRCEGNRHARGRSRYSFRSVGPRRAYSHRE